MWKIAAKPFRRLLGYLLSGFLAILPLVITLAVLMWAFGFIEQMLGPKTLAGKGLQHLGLQFKAGDPWAYFVGWAVILAVIFLLGIALEMGGKRFLQSRVDEMVRKIPVFGGLYGTARQMVDMLDTKAETELKRMNVVYCTFGNGAAFLALMPTPERFRVGHLECHAILIPTAPVPFGGALLFVPADSVTVADISVDAFMSLYVSMGVSGSEYLPMCQPTPGRTAPSDRPAPPAPPANDPRKQPPPPTDSTPDDEAPPRA